MRLFCWNCHKSVSSELGDDAVFRAVAICPECIEQGYQLPSSVVDFGEGKDQAALQFIDAGKSDIVIIYDGKDACKQCLGWKRVDNGQGVSWKEWMDLPAPSRSAVDAGIIKPVVCPRCHGTGVEPDRNK
jgi:hypothetical protein